MNIKGQGYSLTLVQGHLDSTFSNFFSFEATTPIEAKFHIAPPLDGGGVDEGLFKGYMTKMAAMPIYSKKPLKIFFAGTERPMTLKLGMQYWALEYYQVCSSNAPGF